MKSTYTKWQQRRCDRIGIFPFRQRPDDGSEGTRDLSRKKITPGRDDSDGLVKVEQGVGQPQCHTSRGRFSSVIVCPSIRAEYSSFGRPASGARPSQ